VVGASGVVVNLLVLTLLVALKVPMKAAVAGAIAVSMLSNFALNRRFTFSYARSGGILRQLAGFVGACFLGAVVNYVVTMSMMSRWPGILPQLASLVGIVGGTFVNFIVCRFWVFKAAQPAEPPPAA
jgi:dolichol-phosphate mannosyltransferase